MEKNILSEINRNREIMGLGQLLTESRDAAFPIKEAGEIKDFFEKIDTKVKNKTQYKNGVSSIPGYDDLLTKFGQTKIAARHLKGQKITVEQIVVAIMMNLGGIKSFLKAIKNDYTFKVTEAPITVQVKAGNVLTRGHIVGGVVDIDGRHKNGNTNPRVMVSYMNGYNMRHFAAGNGGWDLKEMNDDGFMDYTKGPGEVGPYLFLYATKFGGKQTAADGEDIVDTEKGYQATGKYPTTYGSGDSTPDEKIVQKAVKEILVMFPADVKLDVFTLKAGASANWGEGNTLPDSEGKGNTGYAEGDEGKNQKLAFDRGNNFMMAVNKGLKSQNHPGFDNYEVQWVVKGQDDSDQFIDLMLSVDKEDKIVTRNIGTVVSGDKTKKVGKNTLQRFEVVFTNGSF
jgi:hypothetical protein